MKNSNIITEQQVEQIIQELIEEGFFDRLKATASGTFAGLKQGAKNFQSYMKGDPKGILPPKLMKNLNKLSSSLSTVEKSLTSASNDFNTLFPAGSEADLPKGLSDVISQYKNTLEQTLQASTAVLDMVKQGIADPQALLKASKKSPAKKSKKPAPKPAAKPGKSTPKPTTKSTRRTP